MDGELIVSYMSIVAVVVCVFVCVWLRIEAVLGVDDFGKLQLWRLMTMKF